MSPEEVLEHVRRLADRGDGLFRVHRTHSGLYARARRLFGSWSAAVLAAGLDYGTAIIRARTRALATRSGARPAPPSARRRMRGRLSSRPVGTSSPEFRQPFVTRR